MNKLRGFLDYERNPEPYRPPLERLNDYEELFTKHEPLELKRQAARCMDCGTPFCQTNTGCPVNNEIPSWNNLVFEEQWKEAIDNLHSTNNFPEFTGRVCPAPCEGACVAGIVDQPVTIKNMEYSIVEHAWDQGWIFPRPPSSRSGFKVTVVGGGPAGMAAADELNKKGHHVTVVEREAKVGGLLTYGIPNMKLDKHTVARRVKLMEDEGIEFKCGVEVGRDASVKQLLDSSDALVLAIGSTVPNDLKLPGRDLKGIHFAMDFLTSNQKNLFGDADLTIDAKEKKVVVIGGGDTGTDCIGTSIRQGCTAMVNFELLPMPPPTRANNNPWPAWPRILRTDYGHEEADAKFGADPREYCILSKEFIDDGHGNVKAIKTVNATRDENGRFVEVPGSEKEYAADLVLLAMGFRSPEDTIVRQLNLDLDRRANIRATMGHHKGSKPGVFAAGDCRRGQSLVVWAIREGRDAAHQCHQYLTSQERIWDYKR